MWIKEAVGIVATLLILVSMSFKTLSFKGSFWMRVTNIAGSIIFVVYGSILPAISTAVLNGCLVIVNSYHLYMLIREHRRELKTQMEELEQEVILGNIEDSADEKTEENIENNIEK